MKKTIVSHPVFLIVNDWNEYVPFGTPISSEYFVRHMTSLSWMAFMPVFYSSVLPLIRVNIVWELLLEIIVQVEYSCKTSPYCNGFYKFFLFFMIRFNGLYVFCSIFCMNIRFYEMTCKKRNEFFGKLHETNVA